MAIALQTDQSVIKPKNGHVFVRYTAGSTIVGGQVVAMSADGAVDPADASSAPPTVVGVAKTSAAAGATFDVVVFGPVTSVTGGTPGAIAYVSGATAGAVVEAAPTYVSIVGRVDSATTIFVNVVTALA